MINNVTDFGLVWMWIWLISCILLGRRVLCLGPANNPSTFKRNKILKTWNAQNFFLACRIINWNTARNNHKCFRRIGGKSLTRSLIYKTVNVFLSSWDKIYFLARFQRCRCIWLEKNGKQGAPRMMVRQRNVSFECNSPATPRAPHSNQGGTPGDEVASFPVRVQ